MEKVYKTFGNFETRNKYVCKSEINNDLLKELHVYGMVTVQEVKQIFDSIKNDKFYIILLTGNSKNPKQQRHTKFVKKFVLYKAITKGLPR